MKKPRARQRQGGAVLIEALIVGAALVCVFGCVLAVKLYCSLALQKLDEARQDAWTQSMRGCASEEPVLVDMARELMRGDFPFPDGIIPDFLETQRSYSVTGLVSASGSKAVQFVCNPKPSKEKPLTDMAGWVLSLF